VGGGGDLHLRKCVRLGVDGLHRPHRSPDADAEPDLDSVGDVEPDSNASDVGVSPGLVHVKLRQKPVPDRERKPVEGAEDQPRIDRRRPQTVHGGLTGEHVHAGSERKLETHHRRERRGDLEPQPEEASGCVGAAGAAGVGVADLGEDAEAGRGGGVGLRLGGRLRLGGGHERRVNPARVPEAQLRSTSLDLEGREPLPSVGALDLDGLVLVAQALDRDGLGPGVSERGDGGQQGQGQGRDERRRDATHWNTSRVERKSVSQLPSPRMRVFANPSQGRCTVGIKTESLALCFLCLFLPYTPDRWLVFRCLF